MSYIDKAKILTILRERGMSERADWVDRQLPDQIDPYANASLMRTLRLDDDVLQSATVDA